MTTLNETRASQLATFAPNRAAASSDPQVTEAVKYTLGLAEGHGDPAYAISQTLADPSLTQAQKDDYIAQLVDLASGSGNFCTADGLVVSAEQAEKLHRAFEDIGTAYTGTATPELRQQVTDAFARGVDSGAITADDLYGLVDPQRNPVSDGVRQLMTGIDDGRVLNRVADRLLDDARREGYDINNQELGVDALVAAADIAGMAADHGVVASANAVALEVDRQMAAGPVAGDMTLVQAMMSSHMMRMSYGEPPAGRTGFDALASIVNSTVSRNPAVATATDNLFATLVRSGRDDYPGGIDQMGDRSGALNDLGMYFNENAGRVIEADWRAENTGRPAHDLVTDFMQAVNFDSQYQLQDGTATAVGDEMHRLAGLVADPGRSPDARENAASSLGTLMGSIQEAARQHVESSDDGAASVRGFMTFLSDKVIDKAPPLVSDAGKAAVNALWDNIETSVREGAQATADDAVGGLLDAVQGIRAAMSDLPASLLGEFDLRVELYHDQEA